MTDLRSCDANHHLVKLPGEMVTGHWASVSIQTQGETETSTMSRKPCQGIPAVHKSFRSHPRNPRTEPWGTRHPQKHSLFLSQRHVRVQACVSMPKHRIRGNQERY